MQRQQVRRGGWYDNRAGRMVTVLAVRDDDTVSVLDGASPANYSMSMEEFVEGHVPHESNCEACRGR